MIKFDVLDGHLSRHPEEIPILRKIEPDFDITWGTTYNKFNSDFSVFFLEPKVHMRHLFGFDQELVLAISEYNQLQARFIQAVDSFFQSTPAKGRVDQTVAIFISADKDTSTWISDYVAQNPQTRAYVGISESSLIESTDNWFIRNALIKQLFSRDLFDYTLPLNEDLFFIGRQAVVSEHLDAIKRCENRGLFGLRKTGKTSVLFKIRRMCLQADINCFYYDCKLPSTYRLSCDEMLNNICDDIINETSVKFKKNKSYKNASERFVALIRSLPDDYRLCLIFDEIEYISFLSTLAPHWRNDFTPFWQTLWSTQSLYRKFSFIVAGVNASVTETDKIDAVQNPMFSIVKSRYLTGFEKSEVYSLLTIFGKRMGLRFDEFAVEQLYDRYGGHPLLTRMVCSQINNKFRVDNVSRPISITKEIILNDISSREEEISFYCEHITSELEVFYPDEFEMLELLAIGNVIDFNDLSTDIDLIRHLKYYGLVDFSEKLSPRFCIPVIKGYISSKWRRKTGAALNRYIVPLHRRDEYVSGRAISIIRDFRVANKKFLSFSLPRLHEDNGIAEAEIFANSRRVSSKDELIVFINQSNRSIIEPIDRIGNSLGQKDYYFKDIKLQYSKLWIALDRIRSYRNHFLHLNLNAMADARLQYYLAEDLDGRTPDAVADGWFQLQSAILDGLLVGLQAELSRYD